MDLFGEEPAKEEEVAFNPAAAEEVETFQHPRAMDFCLGHTEVESKLLEGYNSGRLAHGLIFSGPKGIGKATMAYRFAKFLLKQGVNDPNQDSLFGGDDTASISLDIGREEQIFRLVVSGGHPDLMSVERAYDENKGTHKKGGK